jgi:2-alkenal reductase
LLIFIISVACASPSIEVLEPEVGITETSPAEARPTAPVQSPVPTLPAPAASATGVPDAGTTTGLPVGQNEALADLYDQLIQGVVSIHVYINSAQGSGQSAGSGFIIDEQGHIVTNNHVVENSNFVSVVFFDGTEVQAQIVGTDTNSDLAVIQVDQMPEDAHPLPLGDSSEVRVGQWVVAIGNPFELSGTMTIGIISALGRDIEAGATSPFRIPQAIQTDAAINPGNSGGPLIDLRGNVIGVNAQIATGNSGVAANAGVGFAIPSNIVRRVAPALIENGSFQWPWLGVEGGSVNLALQQANNLPTQHGAYISNVVQGGPADKAGMRGATNQVDVGGVAVPVGGDVIIAADGQPIKDFSALLVATSNHNPGEEMQLTVLRDGQEVNISVLLEPRPENFSQQPDILP